MIDLYTWATPNGRKVSIMLEELGLAYEVHPIDIAGEQRFSPEFLKISPNNKIPAIVDRETGIALMESGAILLYLARKTGRLLPADEAGYWTAMQWLTWQMSGLGPMLGRAQHFRHFNPGKSPYAEQIYADEADRLHGVLNRRLAEAEYVAGDYSVADIAIWPWVSRFGWHGVDLNNFANIKRWYRAVADRPAVRRGYDVPNKVQDIPMPYRPAAAWPGKTHQPAAEILT